MSMKSEALAKNLDALDAGQKKRSNDPLNLGTSEASVARLNVLLRELERFA